METKPFDYFQGDYVRAGSAVQSQLTPPTAGEPYADRYTGLVRAQRWNNRALADAGTHRFGGQALMYSYTYDALGQLTAAALGTVSPTALHPGAVVLPVADYALSGISYDLNGNLTSLTRKGQANVSLNMDQLTYHYPVSSGHRTNNRLDKVTDAQTTTAYTSEINLPAGQQTQNYRYSASGQLKADYAEGRFYTYYAGNGRVKAVHANDDYTTGPLASFTYDASGNRLCKTAYASGDAIERTWYLRDASGALLCYVKQDLVAPSTTEELPIPGVGTYLRSTSNVRYELTDHLGNTRVSFTYASNVITVVEAHDYYPHGGLLPGRQLTSTGASPLAYQGQEYDAEVGLTAFNLRQYDARLGRWLTPDPYGQHHSPYLAMSNNPVSFIDRNGGYDEETATNEGGWTYQTLWLIMGGDQNMDDWMHAEYGALTAEEYERVGTFHLSEVEIEAARDNWHTTRAGQEIQHVLKYLEQISPRGWNSRHTTESWSSETGRGAYSGSFDQYKKEHELPSDMSRSEAERWQEGALSEWNTAFGLPSNTPYEGSWDAWYKTTDYYRQDQAHAASGLLLGGYIMAAQMEVFGLGRFPKPHLQTAKGFQFQTQHESFSASIDDVMAKPHLLAGRSLRNVQSGLQYDASGWMESALSRGTHEGQGWKLIDGRNKLLSWHPGGGKHGPNPYWKVSEGHNTTRHPSWGK